MALPVTLGLYLRELRHQSRLTIEQLAERSGISVRTISDIERGVSRAPHHYTLQALAVALGLSSSSRTMLENLARNRVTGNRWGSGASPLRPRTISDFIGRREQLDRLIESVSPASPARIAAITGAPGMGKSTLALAGAAEAGQMFDATYFQSMGGLSGRQLSSAEAARELIQQLAPTSDPGVVGTEPVRLHELLSGRRVLLLLDDVADGDQVRDLLPRTEGSAVILTSRRSLSSLDAISRIVLPPLRRAESVSLLKSIVTESISDEASLAIIADLCRDVPLALRVAGNHIAAREGMTSAQFARELAAAQDRLAALDEGDDRLAATFNLSYQSLEPNSQLTFRRMSLAEDGSVSASTVASLTGLPPEKAQAALTDLVDRSLAQHIPGSRYVLHDLLRLFASAKLSLEESPAAVASARAEADGALLAEVLRAASYFRASTIPDYRFASSTPSSSFDSLDSAATWLVEESSAWLGAYRRAFQRGEYERVATVMRYLHWFSKLWDRWDRWVEVFELSRIAGEALQHEPTVCLSWGQISWFLLVGERDVEGASAASSQALESAQRSGKALLLAWANYFEARSAIARGQADSALAIATETVKAFRLLGDQEALPFAMKLRAEALHLLGSNNESLSALHECLRLIDAAKSDMNEAIYQLAKANTFRLMATVSCVLRDWSAAVNFASASIRLLEPLEAYRLLVLAYGTRVEASRELGNNAHADADLEEIERIYELTGDVAGTDRIRSVLG